MIKFGSGSAVSCVGGQSPALHAPAFFVGEGEDAHPPFSKQWLHSRCRSRGIRDQKWNPSEGRPRRSNGFFGRVANGVLRG